MCTNPVFKRVKNGDIIQFPCGGCLNCRRDSLLLWTARCNSEFVKYRSAFVTLTYNDIWNNELCYPDSRQLRPTLIKAHLDKYIDRLKARCKRLPTMPIGCIPDFKYFCCGEYGQNGLRNHFHCLFFGLDFHDMSRIITDSWKYGFVKVLPILDGGIRYVVDYFSKQVTGDNAVHEYDEKHIARPFKCNSKGLGFSFFWEHRKEICENGFVTIGSAVVPVPSYYSNLFLDFTPEALASRQQRKINTYRKISEAAARLGFASYDDYIAYTREATELSLITQARDKGESARSLYTSSFNTKDLVSEVENLLSKENLI